MLDLPWYDRKTERAALLRYFGGTVGAEVVPRAGRPGQAPALPGNGRGPRWRVLPACLRGR